MAHQRADMLTSDLQNGWLFRESHGPRPRLPSPPPAATARMPWAPVLVLVAKTRHLSAGQPGSL